jgi:hypothetical protein
MNENKTIKLCYSINLPTECLEGTCIARNCSFLGCGGTWATCAWGKLSMIAILLRLVKWDKMYPKTKINFKKGEYELDEIISDASKSLQKAGVES